MKKISLSIAILTLGLTACNDINSSKGKPNNTDSTTTEQADNKSTVALSGYQIGDEVADFNLKNIDGKIVNLAQFDAAKGYIVIFTCNHCPYAKAYEQRIIALDKKYKKDYPIIAINPNDPNLQPEDSYEAMQKNAQEKGFTFPYLFDENQTVYPIFGATKTPHVFLIQKENGKNILKYKGAIDDNYEKPEAVKVKYVENAVDALLANKTIPEVNTLAIGCSIKDKKTAK